jgi:hypothetical protein
MSSRGNSTSRGFEHRLRLAGRDYDLQRLAPSGGSTEAVQPNQLQGTSVRAIGTGEPR